MPLKTRITDFLGIEHQIVLRKSWSITSYIPMDAVVQRSGSDVYINVPKLVASKMPWDKLPSRLERAEKNGAPAATVDKLYRSFEPTGAAKRAIDVLVPELSKLPL